jgi:hypothetical protein
MTERKELGRISRAEFGLGGYQDAMIGVSFTLEGKGWGVGDFWGEWAIARSDHAKWTEADRITRLGEMVMRLNGVMSSAGARSVSQLIGAPVEATFTGNALTSWRVLDEVLP